MQEDVNELPEGLERDLARLMPAGVGIDRDAMMFAAGRAAGDSARRQVRMWRGVAGVCVLAVMGMGWAHFLEGQNTQSGGNLVMRPGSDKSAIPMIPMDLAYMRPRTNVAADTAVTAPPALPSWLQIHMDCGAYLTLRDDVLDRGLIALPLPPANGGRPAALPAEDINSIPAWQRRAVQGDRS